MFRSGYPTGGSKGRGKGFGKVSFHPRRAVDCSISMQVPDGAAGLIIGSKGCYIKELQAIQGIEYVELQGGKVDIGGTSKAVEDAQMKIQAKINKFLRAGKNRPARLQIEAAPTVVAISFARPSGHLAADFRANGPGRNYYVLKPASAMDGLTAQFGMLNMSTHQGEGHAIQAPMSLEEMRAHFQEFLNEVLEMPPERIIHFEIRLGVLAFHTLSEASQNHYALQRFRALVPHKDFKMQFSAQLNFDVAEIEAKLAREGFELIDKDCCTVVHMVSLDTDGEAYTIVFVEPSQGQEGDPRMDVAKRQELERIAQCRSAAEVLEVPSNASKVQIKKAYYKKSLMVHPDKNAYQGSTEAMKVLGTALEFLENGKTSKWQPFVFKVGNTAQDMPQIAKCLTSKTKHFLEEVVRMEGRLGYRVVVSSRSETNKPDVQDFLERAWKKGSIIAGGTLEVDGHHSIDSVRFKEKTLYSDGNFYVELEVVKQKTLESAGHFQTCPEMVLRSPALEEAVAKIRANPRDAGLINETLRCYHDMLIFTQVIVEKMEA